MRCSGIGLFWVRATLLIVTLLGSLAAKASDAATPDVSLGDLQAAVGQLHATVAQMLRDVDGSRREAQQLRQELQTARDEVAAFQRELAEARRRAALETGAAAAMRTEASVLSALRQTSQPDDAGQPDAATPPHDGATALDRRVTTLAEEQQLLSAKIEDQYQTKVESGSKYRVRLSGIVLLNVFDTRGSADNLDLPAFARPRAVLDSSGSFGASLRQSLLGLEVFGPTLGGAKTTGDLQFDFFGGFPEAPDGVTAGRMRMRTAKITFDWPHTSIVAGQDTPFFSPLSPTSLASLAYPAFSAAGNLWVWTPQLRMEHRTAISDRSTFVLQGGILDALTGEPPGSSFYRVPQAGERAGGPAYAARTAWTRAAYGRNLTLGAGGYLERQNWGFDRTVNGWAFTSDWDLPLGPWFSLSGEFYRGRAIGGLGAGDGRSVLFSGPPGSNASSVLGLNSEGGWAQLKFKPIEKLEFNGAWGKHSPFASDQRRFRFSPSYLGILLAKNQSALFNVIYHARSNLLLSAEYRRLWTADVTSAQHTADHVNLSAGILF